MPDTRHEQAKRIFFDVLDLPERDHRAFLDEQCADDQELRRLVVELIDADRRAGDDVFLTNDRTLSVVTLADIDGRAAVSAREIKAPDRIGPIEIGDEIGHGATGVVFRGRDEMLDRDVAVKFLRFIPAEGETADVDEFCAGVRQACRLAHKGLTAIHAADVWEGAPYIVMEHINGPSLRSVLQDRGPLPAIAVASIGRLICQAVGALHDAGIVHRDVKPGNVMLDRNGRVVVTDFGLACDRPYGALGDRSAHVAGTPAYMAPEMFDGVVSTRTDVFAIGVSLYEMLTGKLPFGDSIGAIRENFKAETLEFDDADIPEDLAEIIRRATSRNSVYRFKNAHRMGEAIERLDYQHVDGIRLIGVIEQTERTAAASGDHAEPEKRTDAYYATISRLAERRKTDRAVESAEPPESPESPDALGWDVPCDRCGESLEHASVNRRCRQCGLPVANSLATRRLVFLEPADAARLRRAINARRALLLVTPLALLACLGAGALGTVAASVALVLAFVALGACASFCVRSDFTRRAAQHCLCSTGALISGGLLIVALGALVVVRTLVAPEGGPAVLGAFAGAVGAYALDAACAAAQMFGFRSLDRAVKPAPLALADHLLLILGLPGVIMLGFYTGQSLGDPLDEQYTEARSLIMFTVTLAIVAPWVVAMAASTRAQRLLSVLDRIIAARPRPAREATIPEQPHAV